MDLLWLFVFALLCVGIGGLLIACDRWLAPTKPGQSTKGAA